MNDKVTLDLVAALHRQWFHRARRQGGFCGGCGRVLDGDENVWLERLPVPDNQASQLRVPVGRECASATFLEQTKDSLPEACSWCGRGVYYPAGKGGRPTQRTRALCSRRCGSHASRLVRRNAKSTGA